ncbi:MAG: hypothetical protein EAZ91_06700 [Cytophagales bacterium]|nr:MAG: hypothetical protein EAZ91_06700 [Cytophagales bacterium]
MMLTPQQIDELGPEVLPFERKDFSRPVEEGEDILFDTFIHDVSSMGKPVNVVKVSSETALQQSRTGCYLWIIDKYGLKILFEAIPNLEAKRGVVCHTNITGGQPALQGGELWFGDDDKVYLNYQSGRYGSNRISQRQAILAYFRSLGFTMVPLGDVRR